MRHTLQHGAAASQQAGCLLVSGLPAEAWAQEQQVVNYDFEDEGAGWTVTRLDGDVETNYSFVSGDDCPVGGSNTCLMFDATATTTHIAIYQPVMLIAGETYTVSGAFKGITGDLPEFWTELVLGDTPPTQGQNWQPPTLFGFNAWEGCSGAGIDGSFQGDACVGALADASTTEYVVPGTPGETVTMYLGLKVGRWNETSELEFAVSVDNISVMGERATGTATDDPNELPEQFAIESVYPNPFNPSATLAATINTAGTYTVRVHNVLGQLVHEREVMAQPGRVDVPLDMHAHVSGLYLISVEYAATGQKEMTRAMLLK